MRAFVVVGKTAKADGTVRLDDLAGTSGRLDVLLRSVRAALCVSHGIRRDVRVYLVMLGGDAPRTMRIDGAFARFIRPDERPLATLFLKSIARADASTETFVEERAGIAVACAGIDAVLADLRGEPLYVLEEGASDIRGTNTTEGAFVIGDQNGFDAELRAHLAEAGAQPICVGPTSLHTDDVITVLNNELDRAM